MERELTPPQLNSPESYTALMREIVDSAKAVMKSEAQLMRAELQTAFADGKRRLMALVVGLGLLMLAADALLAAAILSLGQGLGDRYDLAALILSGVAFVAGIGLAIWGWFRLESELKFPASRASLKRLMTMFEPEQTRHA